MKTHSASQIVNNVAQQLFERVHVSQQQLLRAPQCDQLYHGCDSVRRI